jgi:hypothetical protein
MTNVTFSMCGWLSAFFAARCHHHLSFKVPAPSSTSFPFENIISGLEQDQRIYLLSNPKGKGISRPEQGAGWNCCYCPCESRRKVPKLWFPADVES